MSPATIIMIVLICLGCALILAGLVVLAIKAVGLLKAARRAGISSRAHVDEVLIRSRSIAPKARALAAKQEVVAEKLKSVSATTDELGSLKGEIDHFTGRLTGLKS